MYIVQSNWHKVHDEIFHHLNSSKQKNAWKNFSFVHCFQTKSFPIKKRVEPKLSESFSIIIIMKSFAFAFFFAVVGLLGVSHWMTSSSPVETLAVSPIGPDRDLGLIFENCGSFLCGPNRIRYCYFGLPFISEPQNVCADDVPIRNFFVNSLRLVGRARCGFCP